MLSITIQNNNKSENILYKYIIIIASIFYFHVWNEWFEIHFILLIAIINQLPSCFCIALIKVQIYQLVFLKPKIYISKKKSFIYFNLHSWLCGFIIKVIQNMLQLSRSNDGNACPSFYLHQFLLWITFWISLFFFAWCCFLSWNILLRQLFSHAPKKVEVEVYFFGIFSFDFSDSYKIFFFIWAYIWYIKLALRSIYSFSLVFVYFCHVWDTAVIWVLCRMFISLLRKQTFVSWYLLSVFIGSCFSFSVEIVLELLVMSLSVVFVLIFYIFTGLEIVNMLDWMHSKKKLSQF